MPLLQPPSPVAPPRRPRTPWRIALAGGAAAALIALLVFTGEARLLAGLAAALAVVVLTVILTVRTFREEFDARPAQNPAEAPAEDSGPAFEAVLETLPEPVMVIAAQEADDLAGRRFVLANAAARDLFRISGDRALLVTAIRNPEVLEAVDESLFGGVPGEAAYETAGTQERVWKALARPLQPAADGTRRALLLLRDETDARRSERTRADFLANASHELRTPLASLAGFIETLRGHAKDDPGARDRFLEIMSAQAERMSRLIDDLMSLSRIELNEHIAPHGRVDMAMAATDVVDALQPLARRKQVAIETRSPPRGAAIAAGDRDQMVQVIQNLIDNAVKYSPSDCAVEVEIAADQTPETALALRNPRAARLSLLMPDVASRERYVSVRVTDHGAGIAREHLPRLTERFYRVEGQKSGDRLGTGLGLAIVKHIMNRHRGGLAVESLEGEGTTFTVYFPMASAEAAPPPMRPVEASATKVS